MGVVFDVSRFLLWRVLDGFQAHQGKRSDVTRSMGKR